MFQRLTTAIAATAIALTLFCASALAADAYEPNETPATATGPLVGGQLYSGSVGSSLDDDFYYFYTAGAGTFHVAFDDYGDPWYGCRKEVVALTAGGDLLDYESSWGSYDIYGGGLPSSTTLSFAVTSAAKVYVRVSGISDAWCWNGNPDSYTLRALPAEAVTLTAPTPAPPAPPSKKCLAAKAGVDKSLAATKRLKKKLANASGRQARKLRAKLRGEKQDLARFRKQVKKYC